jgi:hypothetical protein
MPISQARPPIVKRFDLRALAKIAAPIQAPRRERETAAHEKLNAPRLGARSQAG